MHTNFDDLLDEVRLLYNAMLQRGEILHADQKVTMSQRAILEYLLKHGPGTVPHIARRRNVTRQHVQALVNPLIDAGLIARSPNPDHQRSVLIGLTDAGEATITDMRRREATYLDEAGPGISADDIARATATLRALRESIE